MTKKKEVAEEKKQVNKTGKVVDALAGVLKISQQEWSSIAKHFMREPMDPHIKTLEYQRYASRLHLGGKLPSDRQLADALKIRDQAYEEGFNFIS